MTVIYDSSVIGIAADFIPIKTDDRIFQFFDKLLKNRLRHKDIVGSDARLPRIHKFPPHDPLACCGQLCRFIHNDRTFPAKLYGPEDIPWEERCRGKYGDTAKRKVTTIFDYETAPYSNMVLGEIMNDPGNWCGYLPHSHPQPELYYFKFERPEGFGASFVGEDVYYIKDGSFSAIPGGKTHPQSAAPGYRMYIIWMIRHFDDNPWTVGTYDERFTWLDEV